MTQIEWMDWFFSYFS